MFPRLALVLALAAAGCSSAYYSTLERFGVDKRDILVDRIEAGREAQAEAKQQFRSALDAFRALTGFRGGELEEVYERLDAEYRASQQSADEVNERIAAIERVARDLFGEWEDEIESMGDRRLRADSTRLLRDTKARYGRLDAAMQRAARSMEPVLSSLRDHVLHLKHNLNARAIAALEGELGSIDTRVRDLVREMEKSIAEADSFLEAFESSRG